MTSEERHIRFYMFVRPLVKRYLKGRFSYAGKDVSPLPEGPYIVMANHASDFDPLMLGSDFPRHMYFLASEHVYRLGFASALIRRYIKPIAKIKGSSDMKAVKDLLRTLKKGHSVAFFPEGSRTFNGESDPVTEAAAKLVLASGVPLVTYRLHGGYLATPRWAKTERKGRTTGEYVHTYMPEETRALGVSGLTKAISDDIYIDAYAEQRNHPVPFSGERLAEGLEETLYLCPSCGKIGTLKGKDSHFTCSSCGYDAAMDEYGFFTGNGLLFTDVLSWDRFQKQELGKRLSDSSFSLEDPSFTLSRLDGDLDEVLGTGSLKMTREALSFSCNGQVLVFPMSGLEGFAIIHRNKAESLVFTCEGVHYQLSTETDASRYKYFSMYKLITGGNRKSSENKV